MFVEILQNGALLFFSAIGVYFFGLQRNRGLRDISAAGIGMTMGAVCFLVTVTPISMPGGATVDARAGPVILAGMLGGPLPALLAAGMGAVGRMHAGGSFAFLGTMSFLVYALAGSIAWWFTAGCGRDPLRPKPIFAAVLLSFAAAGTFFFLIQPRSVAHVWIVKDYPWIVVANTISILLVALVSWVATMAAMQRKRLQETVKALHLAQETALLGVWQWDPAGSYLTQDPEFRRMHGIEADAEMTIEAIFAERLHPEDRTRVSRLFRDALAGRASFDTEYRVIRPKDTDLTLRSSAAVMKDAAGHPARMVGVCYDLTSLRAKEAELVSSREIIGRTQRLDVIGKLTGGVAHDFSNLLSVIQGNLELLLEDVHDPKLLPEQRAEMLNSSIAATRQGTELTRNMLSFAMCAPLEPNSISINRTLEDTKKWLTRTLPSNIEVILNLQENCWFAHLDEGSLQSAIVNIIVNARDSMPKGGVLEIETANVRIDDSFFDDSLDEMPPGRYVMLALQDTGEGIPKDQIDHIFEPFFSPSKVNEGNNLGLSMAYGFTNQSGGFVHVTSKIGTGTTFKLFFPAEAPGYKEDEPVEIAFHETSDQKKRHPTRILVCEDEFEVLAVLVRILQSAGFDVETAISGDDAFMLMDEKAQFDVLLTDVVMPGKMQGPDLAAAARRRYPDIPVIYLTGYADNTLVKDSDLKNTDTLLMKPVQKTALLQAIERACAKSRLQLSA